MEILNCFTLPCINLYYVNHKIKHTIRKNLNHHREIAQKREIVQIHMNESP